MILITNKGKDILFSILNSYSQVFFSTSKTLALFLVVISFFDYGAGIGGLLAVIVANSFAWGLGFNKYLLNSGMYGFNALLTGLGVGLFYQPSPEVYILIAISALTCFIFTVVFQGVLGKYGLPYLSIPFLITIWIVAHSPNSLTAQNLSERGIFFYNELYSLGGNTFINFYELLEANIKSSFIRIYFHSLGAIFFQTNIFAGIIIAAGILIYSRITFVLSILGYTTAFFFYKFAGIEFDSLGYTFIGFNYILTAIALGGYYLVPGRVSIGWTILLLPAVVLITISSRQIFMLFKISPYSLPFNVIVLTFLYALKLREQRPRNLIETPVQMGKPETNLYLYSRNIKRFPAAFPVSAILPFYGEWTVSQAHNGEYTHKGAWRHAWDFIITDANKNQFKNSGDLPEDYYCFGKSVLAPADGEIAGVVDNIRDNTIGDVNTKDNWGNTVIIKHNDYLFSKLSHLKFQSVKVKPGNKVKKGQIIALCGNSGRSPYPHLHFQFQSKPYVGSGTIDYPLGQFLVRGNKGYILKSFDYPVKDEILANPPINEVLEKALHFIPGRRIKISLETESSKIKWKKMAGVYHWNVDTDIYNNTFISCEEHNGRAYLYNNGDMHYFTNFSGKKYSPLFWFFIMLYKVPLGFLPKSRIIDSLPVNHLFGGILKILQDFAAPFYLFLNADYQLTIIDGGDIISSGNVNMHTQVTKKIAGKKIKLCVSKLNINQQGDFNISIETKEAKIRMICQNELE